MIDPEDLYKAAYRETQGQPVDAVGREAQVIAKPSIHLAKLMSFEKDGHQGIFDIIDGKFDYTGDLPVSDAARLLFETLAQLMSEWWFERAAAKTASAKDAQQDGGLVDRLHKRADNIGQILTDPPKHHPDATLMREAATALAEKDARIAELLAADEVRASDISRLTIERDEAHEECERLRAALSEVCSEGRILSGGIRRPAKWISIPGEVFARARAALSQKETGV